MNLNPSCQKRGKFDCPTVALLIEPNSVLFGSVLYARSSYIGVLKTLYASARNWNRIRSLMRNVLARLRSNCSNAGRRMRGSRIAVERVWNGSRIKKFGAVQPYATELAKSW